MRIVWRDIADINPMDFPDNKLVTFHSWFVPS